MSPRPAIIDTNVLVSGLITKEPNAPTRVIVAGMATGAFRFVLSEALLAEYVEVLMRAAIRKLHGLSDAEIKGMLTEMTAHAAVVDAAPAEPAPDPKDNHLWALLKTQSNGVLVTGDKRLIDEPPPFGSVCTPREFVDSLEPKRKS